VILRIGITMFWEANSPERTPVYGPWRYTLNQCYLRLLDGMDALPVGLLPGGDCRSGGRLDGIHGLVMTGGGDPAPGLYGMADQGSLDPEIHRPVWEMELYREARAAGIPILAICLGMQLVAIAGGEALVQHIPASVGGAIDHQKGLHRVTLSPGSELRRLLGGQAMVHSSHHQAIKSVPAGFSWTACAPDGVIEAIESTDGLVKAVQWHPERDSTGPALAGWFAGAARERR
jgi:putative glutamine amidotransferase